MNNHKTEPAGEVWVVFFPVCCVSVRMEKWDAIVLIVTHSELLHTGLRCFFGRQKGKVGRKHISIVSGLQDGGEERAEGC